MARPLRIEIPGGRYHLCARGNERRAIFRDQRDRQHFLELLGELPERFGILINAFVLMANHFHLLVETPEANLSRTGQWLNVSGRSLKERQRALCTYTEEAVRKGLLERPLDRLIGGVVLGSEAFARKLFKQVKRDVREQRGLRPAVAWKEIVAAVVGAKGEPWEKFCNRHGDWGRDAALWLGRRAGRMSLRKLANLVGGLDYTTVGAAVSRFRRRLSKDAKLMGIIRKLEQQLSNVEM